MTDILKRVKTIIGVEDNKQDEVLDIFIANAKSHLLALFRKVNKEITSIPEETEYIIEEITVRRYNRLGSEGFKSELVEGHRVDFYDLKDEFDPYLDIIDSYKEPEKPKRGKVMLL